ncbi:ester cyclase [Nocardia vinacea]|uniref:ester cyclase n=1 Tax=Nocardia vinacea TaxID=96468 RepID=UPI0033E195B0
MPTPARYSAPSSTTDRCTPDWISAAMSSRPCRGARRRGAPRPSGHTRDALGKEWPSGMPTPGRHEIEDQIAEGDRVVTRITAYGRHVGDLPGIPATGHELTMTGTTIHRIEDGKITEKWSDKDVLGLLQQLGVLPPLKGP